jgi:hypothetical protein
MSGSSLSGKINKGARLFVSLGLAASVAVFAADRAALAGCGGGGGGGGGRAAAPAPDESFQPKKLSPGDRAKLTKIIQIGSKIVNKTSNVNDKTWEKRFGDFVDQAKQILDDLDKKGYDTDPEYESDVNRLKHMMSTGVGNGGYSPPTGFVPGTTNVVAPK